jgi:hypothetical protein
MHIGTIMESRDATFLKMNFLWKNAPSTTSHESIILHEQFILIEHSEKPHVHNPEEDDIIVTRKSKRQRTTKSFGDDYIITLWMIYQEP